MQSYKGHGPDVIDYKVYYPFGRRKSIDKHGNECTPPSYSGKPSGWPHLQFQSSIMRCEMPSSTDVLDEEQYDKYTPVETYFDREYLIDRFVKLMSDLEKTDKGLCCDKVFQEESRFLKKAGVPRRPNCPMLRRASEPKIFDLDSIKLKDTPRPPTIPVFFRKPRNPFDLSLQEQYPENKRSTLPTNRRIHKLIKVPSYSELLEGLQPCVPVDSYKSHPCYGK